MNKITNSLKKTASRAGLKLRKHSPEILLVTGLVGGITATVFACKSTTKIEQILEENKEQVNKIHDLRESVVNAEPSESTVNYSEEDEKKDLTIVYAQTSLKLAKLYAPSIIIGGLSIACIITSTRILKNRNASLAAAFMTVDQSFKAYKQRVADRFGEDVEKEIRYNVKKTETEDTEIDKNGKTKKIKREIKSVDNLDNPYAKFFDSGCKNWEDNPEYNLMFLKKMENYFNDILVARGHVFLNEVYDALGIPRTKLGQTVGWYYEPNNKQFANCIDFGIYNIYNDRKREFVNGYEPVILLDFNVDGDILSMI